MKGADQHPAHKPVRTSRAVAAARVRVPGTRRGTRPAADNDPGPRLASGRRHHLAAHRGRDPGRRPGRSRRRTGHAGSGCRRRWSRTPRADRTQEPGQHGSHTAILRKWITLTIRTRPRHTQATGCACLNLPTPSRGGRRPSASRRLEPLPRDASEADQGSSAPSWSASRSAASRHKGANSSSNSAVLRPSGTRTRRHEECRLACTPDGRGRSGPDQRAPTISRETTAATAPLRRCGPPGRRSDPDPKA